MLDSGMVAGVLATLSARRRLEHELQQQRRRVRELFISRRAASAQFEIGGTDGSAFKMHYTSPWFVPGNGVDSPNILNVNAFGLVGTTITTATIVGFRHSTFSLMAADANKVTYFTPRFAGFQLGLSYTPETTYNGPNPNGLFVNPNNTSIEDVVEVALNYAGSFGGLDLGLSGFYVTGDAPAFAGGDPEELGFGANLGFGGFTLGGAWYQSEDLGLFGPSFATGTGVEEEVWTVGLSYATGPWTVGVAYLQDEISVTGVADNKMKTWQAGGGYNLGSGVDVGLDLQMSDVETAFGDFESQSAGLVLSVSF
ncbi:MAG: porin [Parvibaculum sp.]|nr:porin [Parvibaculum sp.]